MTTGKQRCVAVVATMIAVVMFALPADARAKKQRPDTQKRYQAQQTLQSLDGRTLGRMRTCGFDYLQYDGLGVPYGPYCHDPQTRVGLAPVRPMAR